MLERKIKISELELLHKIDRVESYLNRLKVLEEDLGDSTKKLRIISSANELLDGLKEIIEEAKNGESKHERKLS